MPLPFTPEQFFEVFRQYHASVWPAPVLLTLLGLAATAAAAARPRWAGRFVSGALAGLWTWTGVVYHLRHFSSINPVAYVFAALAVGGAAAFAWHGVAKNELGAAAPTGGWLWLGAGLQGYALLLYPVLSAATGHRYPAMPTFGLPCPTTIYTAGILAWFARSVPLHVLVVPTLWSLVGVQAAWLLGVWPDLALLAVPATSVALVVRRRWPARSGIG
jgi:hypothetical protein